MTPVSQEIDEFDDDISGDARKVVSAALAAEMQTRRSLSQLAASIGEECVRIESNQTAWIVGGLYMKPDPVMIAKLADLQQIHDFLEACRTRPGDVARRLRSRGNA